MINLEIVYLSIGLLATAFVGFCSVRFYRKGQERKNGRKKAASKAISEKSAAQKPIVKHTFSEESVPFTVPPHIVKKIVAKLAEFERKELFLQPKISMSYLATYCNNIFRP